MATFGPANVAQDGTEQGEATWADSNYTTFERVGRTVTDIYNAGFRWTGVTVPQGATVSLADFDFEAQDIAAGFDILWHGVDEDDAAVFSGANRPSQVTPTTANTNTTSGITANQQNTIDVTTSVQEVINRGSFSSGNALALIGLNNAGAAGVDDFIKIDNGNFTGATVAATLEITYTAGGPPAGIVIFRRRMENAA